MGGWGGRGERGGEGGERGGEGVGAYGKEWVHNGEREQSRVTS